MRAALTGRQRRAAGPAPATRAPTASERAVHDRQAVEVLAIASVASLCGSSSTGCSGPRRFSDAEAGRDRVPRRQHRTEHIPGSLGIGLAGSLGLRRPVGIGFRADLGPVRLGCTVALAVLSIA